MSIPTYLKGYEAQWQTDPRAANRAWFADAKWGLFIHYGLYSLMGTGEWAQYQRRIPVADYATLAPTFTAKNFDADRITDLACEVGMRYVTLVTCHHEGFPLWGSPSEPFNSVNAPCGRDLVGEMAQQCAKKGLGFFTYYTFMLNWRTPHFLSTDLLSIARPHYERPQPEYLSDDVEGFREHYVPYMLGHLRELLTGYGPLAGMWLDIIFAYYLHPEVVPIRPAYDLVRELQPAALLCFKQGATGEEDFATPEHRFRSLGENMRKAGGEEAARRADAAWEQNRHKHNEICTTLQKGGPWGWKAEAEHATADDVWAMLAHAHANNCNLLANVGPLADGSLHPADVAALREVGRRARAHGWPGPEEAALPEVKSAPAQ